MSKLRDIVAFARVAELGGFTAAAKSLHTTSSAITKAVARLEADLGAQLFNRTTRGLHPTEYGREFHRRCVRLLGDLENAELAIREANAAPRGVVRLCVPPSFGRLTIIPNLPAFFRRYPEIRLDMPLNSQPISLIEGGFDLSVFSGKLTDSSLVTRILVHGPQKTVASPAYLKAHGAPRTPDDLLRHDCIVGRFGPDWTFLDRERRPVGLRVSGSLTTDSGDALREAAVAGIGISQATWWLFRNDLEAGTLVPILEDFDAEGDPISIIYPANRYLPAKVRAVIDFLVEITRDSRRLAGPDETVRAVFESPV